MKSLEQERNQRGVSSKDIMVKLSNLQTQIDEKFPANYETASTRPLTPLSHVSRSELTLGITTKDEGRFSPFATSSPHERRVLSKTLPTIHSGEQVQQYLNSMDGNYLSQSLPEPFCNDQGYHSPSHETSTISFYFAEQIKAITNTFDKIERLDSTNSPTDQINLEIWKQKIHFRLKVLEDQMGDMETSSNYSSGSSGKSTERRSPPRASRLKDITATNVIFHPSTDEIRPFDRQR